jgi:hypothetical protein
MSVRIADLAARVKRMSVRIGGEVIEFGYKPGVITQAFLNDPRPMTASLPEVIADWNLEIKAGEPVPITEDGLKMVPTDVLNLIWAKCYLDVLSPHEDDEKKD